MRLGRWASGGRVSPAALAVLAVFVTWGCEQSPNAPAPIPGPPSVSCPANVTVTGITGSGQPVTYPMPVTTGGTLPVTSSCTPPSNASFPLGATPVTCTAIDAQQRQATCTFMVTLQPLVIGIQKAVAFGDSVTAGEDGRSLQIRVGFVDPLRSYPAVLQSTLARDFPNQAIPVVNEGLGGEFAEAGVRRLPRVLQTHRPDVLLLLHGYNDLLNDGLDAVDDLVDALRDDVRIARTSGVAHVFVSTLTPSRPATGPRDRAIDPRAIQETNARLSAMVPAEGASLVRTFEAFAGREQQLVGDDGLHLTVAGNEVLAETFYRAMRDAGLTALQFRREP